MIFAQVCRRLATMKSHSKMCSFITQHNATAVASFKGACKWHADCRNVQQSGCPWIKCSFLYHKSTPAQDLHIQHLHLQDHLRPATRTAAATISLHYQIISAQTVRNRLRQAHLHARRPHWGLDLTVVCLRNRLEWANAHIKWHLVLWRGVLFMDEYRFSLHRADDRQRVWRRVGEWFADVNVVDWVGHGGGRVMVWAGVCYGQRTQVHFIDGILNAQRYRDEIMRPIVVPFIHDHHIMLQHDNARPHVARICSQFLEAENIPVFAWPAYSLDMSPIEHVWNALDQEYTTVCSSSCKYPATSHSHWRGVDQHSTSHSQQPDQLYVKEMCCTAWGKWWSHQILTGFRNPPKHKPLFNSDVTRHCFWVQELYQMPKANNVWCQYTLCSVIKKKINHDSNLYLHTECLSWPDSDSFFMNP